MPKALITGITGQDGSYLAQQLLSKGYQVVGLSRDPVAARTHSNLIALGVAGRVSIEREAAAADLGDQIARLAPHEIYHLAGQSSVGASFHEPVETINSIAGSTLAICEALRLRKMTTRLIVAGSGDCYGDAGGKITDESTPFQPASPYAVAKASARWTVNAYRSAYGIHASTAILFNHESPLRHQRFVTAKIVAGACRIADELANGGRSDTLHLGNIEIERDWGWAPDYTDAMWRMAQVSKPEDLIVATGHSCSLKDFIAAAFDAVGLEWHEHVVSDPSLLRPQDPRVYRANPGRAKAVLGWSATHRGAYVARLMVEHFRAKCPLPVAV